MASGFALLPTRRFGPMYATQFLGAFNDNLLKNALVIMITFKGVGVFGLSPEMIVALAGGLFILPYFLFSAFAGELADRVDKAAVIRWTKVAEIGICLAAAFAFWAEAAEVLLALLFAMGLHGAMFGPSKYSILPQLLPEKELVAGNAMVEQGTYLAILLGTLAGGLLVSREGGTLIVGGALVAVAVLGTITAFQVPAAPPTRVSGPLRWSLVGPTRDVLAITRRYRPVWLAALGISWFWLFGATFLSLFAPWTKNVLHGDASLATLFLALFSVGIGVGSLLCERLSHHRLELGIVPIGALGLTVFTADLAWVGEPWVAESSPLGVMAFLSRPTGVRIAIDLLLIAISGGLMIVPLYTFLQWRSAPHERSRVIAGNNILNAIFMVVGALMLAVLLGLGLGPTDVFAVLAVLNVVAAIVMYRTVPEFVLRFVAWMLSNVVYRVRVGGLERVPVDGPVVLVCNHVSYIDWLILAGAVKRPPRFVMDRDISRWPVARWLFTHARCIPICPEKVDAEVYNAAFEAVHEELADGGVVCIFPEGRLTPDGSMMVFKRGIERIIARDPVPVVPMALNGLWGSFFSRRDGKAFTRPFRRFWSRVHLWIGDPIAPADVTADGLHAIVHARHSAMPERP